MERFVNILVVDSEQAHLHGLQQILSGGGNNVVVCSSHEDALALVKRREVGIALINTDELGENALEYLKRLENESKTKNMHKIALTMDSSFGSKRLKGLHDGVVDFLQIPFNPNVVKAKVDVFKSLYFKTLRISQLLENIFPVTVLEDLNVNKKFSPKRVNNGIVLFTDFVDFSAKARDKSPLRLVNKLEHYFSQFDEIIKRYKLEKIKTIGDAYMALAGVTENTQNPAIRACLAALEIRDIMRNDSAVSKALGQSSWDIRIGIHSGPLVAGIIGKSKMSFDVWGDTVNIAARAEAGTSPGTISVTSDLAEQVKAHFNLTHRGAVTLPKRGGQMEMFFLEGLKSAFCLYDEGNVPSSELRRQCGLSSIDFEHMRKEILNRLKALLPDRLVYHDIDHTLNIEKAALRLTYLEGIDEEEVLLLRTAVLYHDAGFIEKYNHNEDFAIGMARNALPKYGYSIEQIDTVCRIIQATKSNVEPVSALEKIMCDADHDYLGRADYYAVAKRLRNEMANYNRIFTEKEWCQFQLEYLEKTHQFYTETAKNIRLQAKQKRIAELKEQLNQL
jgi:class 3 adenylate cyclase/HD superfamily phosphodiesterase/ActR/RegA family two-component response regulator